MNCGNGGCPRARILGPGLTVTIEGAAQHRWRVIVSHRAGRTIDVQPLDGAGPCAALLPGQPLRVRAARPFGLFTYDAQVECCLPGGAARLRLDSHPARRRQLRGYFRMPVRLGVRLEEMEGHESGAILQAVDLSAGGVLTLDPERRLAVGRRVRLGLPVLPRGDILRLEGRVVRAQDDPRRVAIAFEEIADASRQKLLRYLFREHRRRRRRRQGRNPSPAQVISLWESP